MAVEECPICHIIKTLDGVVGTSKQSDEVDTHTLLWYLVGAMHAYESTGNTDLVLRTIRLQQMLQMIGHTEFRRSFSHAMETEQ